MAQKRPIELDVDETEIHARVHKLAKVVNTDTFQKVCSSSDAVTWD